MLVTMTTVSFYMITAYTPTFGTAVLKLSATAAFTVTMCVGLSNLVLLPVMGAVSDRVGRKPLLYACTILMLVSAYPAMRWLVGAPSFGRLLTVELWLAILYASYNGAMVVFLTEMIPLKLRASGLSLAYSLAAALFGGFTPAISAALIHATGNHAAPGAWLAAAAVSLAAIWSGAKSLARGVEVARIVVAGQEPPAGFVPPLGKAGVGRLEEGFLAGRRAVQRHLYRRDDEPCVGDGDDGSIRIGVSKAGERRPHPRKEAVPAFAAGRKWSVGLGGQVELTVGLAIGGAGHPVSLAGEQAPEDRSAR